MHATNDLDTWVFDNRFTRELVADPILNNNRRQVHGAMYSRVTPTPVSAPTLVAWSRELAADLGLNEDTVRSQHFADVFGGNALVDGMDPHAMCYGGHQFGNWAGQLGDGRAINLGEVRTADHGPLMLQLKGAGPTPYSRSADGLAVLRSSLREFICSEAMHHLGVPTTRALSLVLTGNNVLRDMFYDGHPAYEPGAIVCRVAPSFLRLGNFEIFTARRDTDALKQLADFTLRHHFADLGEPSKDAYIQFFNQVCERTADMIIDWQRVGFVHGVMNTDNLSVLGLTIDYGPYGWLEDYDNAWTPNTTYAHGRRYCFANQPKIGQWNLIQFANALYPLIEDATPLQEALAAYAERFDARWHAMMARKLGLSKLNGTDDADFCAALFTLLEAHETDMTLFFRALSDFEPPAEPLEYRHLETLLQPALYGSEPPGPHYRKLAGDWFTAYAHRVANDPMTPAQRRQLMQSTNPLYVFRNYLAQLCIDKVMEGDYSRLETQLEVLRRPYDVQPGREEFAQKRPDWAKNRAGCSMLSCSS